ncbi:MAG: GatB/YqeY domain-containing protein [Clostridia bacterium]|nr:GatB/YqeY domain-containing protein [Clostridia bacterium]
MKEKLLEELKLAMKEKDELRKNTITMLRAAILQIEKDEQKTLNDEEIQVVVSKEVKKRKESIEEFRKAERNDLAEDLEKEIEILSKYLPEQLSEEEVEKIVKEAINALGVTSIKDMGKVMQEVRPKTQGKADGKLVSDLVRKLLV